MLLQFNENIFYHKQTKKRLLAFPSSLVSSCFAVISSMIPELLIKRRACATICLMIFLCEMRFDLGNHFIFYLFFSIPNLKKSSHTPWHNEYKRHKIFFHQHDNSPLSMLRFQLYNNHVFMNSLSNIDDTSCRQKD